jgi:hypothetical protein
MVVKVLMIGGKIRGSKAGGACRWESAAAITIIHKVVYCLSIRPVSGVCQSQPKLVWTGLLEESVSLSSGEENVRLLKSGDCYRNLKKAPGVASGGFVVALSQRLRT